MIEQNNFEFKLAAFDFDYTVINANSSTYLNKLVIEHDTKSKNYTPSIAKLNKFRYPLEIEQLYDKKNLTIRQNAIFNFMNANLNIKREDMEKCLNEIQLSQTMKQLFQT